MIRAKNGVCKIGMRTKTAWKNQLNNTFGWRASINADRYEWEEHHANRDPHNPTQQAVSDAGKRKSANA